MESCAGASYPKCKAALEAQHAVSVRPAMAIMWLTGESAANPAAAQCARVAEIQATMPWVMEGTDFYDGSHVTCNRTARGGGGARQASAAKTDDNGGGGTMQVLLAAGATADEAFAAEELSRLLGEAVGAPVPIVQARRAGVATTFAVGCDYPWMLKLLRRHYISLFHS